MGPGIAGAAGSHTFSLALEVTGNMEPRSLALGGLTLAEQLWERQRGCRLSEHSEPEDNHAFCTHHWVPTLLPIKPSVGGTQST